MSSTACTGELLGRHDEHDLHDRHDKIKFSSPQASSVASATAHELQPSGELEFSPPRVAVVTGGNRGIGLEVNNAGIAGTITEISNPETFRQEELNNIDNLSEHRLDELSELFLKDFKDGQLEHRGWPTEGGFTAYKVSKAIMNAYSRILAKEHPSLSINCVHPGFVQTDMNFQVGDLTVEEGAKGVLMMALAPKGGMTGGFLNRTEFASFV
nr:unnamed protein product [Digitaria exilis]